MNKKDIKKLTTMGVLIAAFVVLGSYLSFELVSPFKLKFTFQNMPSFLAALIYSPIEGMGVAFIGMLLAQMLTYGFGSTTLLWCIPQSVGAFLLGCITKKYNIKVANEPRFWVVVISVHLIITVLNTIVLVIDAMIYKQNMITIITSTIPRVITSIAVGIIYAYLIPAMIKILKSFIE